MLKMQGEVQKPIFNPSRNHELFWGIIIHLFALVLFTWILLSRSPNFLRPLSMNARFGFTLIVPMLFVILCYSFRLRGRLGQWSSLSATLALFALALAGMWSSGHTQSTLISGLIPMYDAATYYVDALRLLAGRTVQEFSTARPLFAGLLATLLAATDRNLAIALGILAAINGMASYYVAREIKYTHGSLAAAFLVMFVFLYYRHRTVGTVMSENLGLPLGLLGVALIWRGISQQSSKLVLYGLFILTVGLNSRPGPFFILPALLAWGAWYFKKPDEFCSWHFFMKGVGAIVAGFAINLAMVRLIGMPSGTPFSELAYAFYGLASGGNSFSYVLEAHPELNQLPPSDQVQTIYMLAFDLIRSDPSLIIKGAFYNWSMVFSSSAYSVYSYISGENDQVNIVARWSLYFLCLLGGIKWIKKSDPYISFVMAASAGIFISVPLVPPADAYGMRLYAAGIVILGLLPMLGLIFAAESVGINVRDGPFIDHPTDSGTLIWSGGIFVILLLVGPLLTRWSHTAPEAVASLCQPNTSSIVIRYDPGSSIHLIREKDLALDWMPVFHPSLFKRNVHGLPDIYLAEWLETIDLPSTLFYTLDYKSNQAALVIAPTRLLPQPGTIVELCGDWVDEPSLQPYSIFIAEDTKVIPG